MRRTKDEWAKVVAAYRNSGLTMRRFCQTEGIVAQSLHNWITRVKSAEATPGATHGFVEVRQEVMASRRDSVFRDSGETIADRGGHRNGLTIRFRDGSVIEVSPDTDRPTLEWVLTLMEGRR